MGGGARVIAAVTEADPQRAELHVDAFGAMAQDLE
jgi:hypothetical protein